MHSFPANLILIFLLMVVISCASTTKVQKEKTRIIRELNANEIPFKNGIIAITNVSIIDGNGGDAVANGTVVVTDSLITATGTGIKIPDGAEIIDGSGMSILPGFIDAHFHLEGINELAPLFLQNGVTSIRDPGAWIETYNDTRNSGKPVPRLFLCGPHIDMYPPAYPKDAYVVRDASEAVKQVHKLADSGATAIKIYFRLPPDIIHAVCDAAHSRGLPVTGHLEITEAMEAIGAGLDGIEHITSFGLSLQSKMEGEKYRQLVLGDNNGRKKGRYEVWDKIDINGRTADTLVDFLVRKKTFVSPTLGAFEYQFPKEMENEKPDTLKLRGFDKMKAFTGKLKMNGVRIVVGSHSLIPYAETGWAFQREMELLSESGLSNGEVIVAATIENARFFRIDDRLGSIEEGKIADLILVEGNPLQNISDSRKIKKVMLNGVWVKK